ncbi:hypothetical protein DV738_g54, partial [Chaetothyriales sp. CBS 135597]
MGPRPDRSGQTSATARVVRLLCAECDTSLGTFENEWIRLTSSYARPKQRGRHTMTEIGNRVQHVPVGVSQKAAEGCGMAEVFCRVCSCLVGQYCKTAPNREKQELVDNYFYKFSKTFLIDADSLAPVDPVFTYGGDLAEKSAPVPPRPRLSKGTHTRLKDSQYRRASGQHSRARARGRIDSVSERHSPGDGTVSEYESGVGSQSNSILQEKSAMQHEEKEDAAVKDQQKQITALSNQIDTLKTTLHDLSTMVHKLYAERREHAAETSTSASASSASHVKTSVRMPLAPSDELERLRAENEQLRQRFAMIESVMGVKPDTGRGLGRGEGSQHSNGLPSKDHLPTPSASQQSSFEIQQKPGVSIRQEDTEAQAGTPSGEIYPPPDNHDEDTEMQLGSEPCHDSSSDAPVLNSSTLKSAPPNEEHTLTTAAGSCSARPHSNHLQPTMAPTQTPASVPSKTKAEVGLHTRPSTEPWPQFQSSPPPPLYGVIRPPKKAEKVKPSTSAQLKAMHYAVTTSRLDEDELVEFSDDENPVAHEHTTIVQSQPLMQLHYGTSVSGPPRAPGVSPWTAQEPAVVHQTRTTPFRPREPNSSSRPTSSSDRGSINLQIQITGPEQVRDCLEKGESPFRDIKEPREKKPPIQTTERLLNEELIELGMDEWIGKDKNTKEYRQLIEQARAKRREKKKQEALAKAGVISAPDSVSPEPTAQAIVPVTRGKPGRPSKQSLTSQSPNDAKRQPKPLAEATDRQAANKPDPNTSKRKATALDDSDVEATDEHPLDADSPQTRKPAGRKSRKSWSQPDMGEPMMTRRQTRAAEINKLESRGHEEMEEVIQCVEPK